MEWEEKLIYNLGVNAVLEISTKIKRFNNMKTEEAEGEKARERERENNILWC